MSKKGYDKYLDMVLGLAAIGSVPHSVSHSHLDPSTKHRKETCPECGETHNRDGHIFCSEECHQERKRKIKSGKLK